MKMEKSTNTHVETIEFTREQAEAWTLAPFQRPLTINEKVRKVAQQIKDDGGVIPGIICFGVLDKITYLLDGQQRRAAFILSEKPVGYADARFCRFTTMAQMSREFVDLNAHLVSMKPDDNLRGLEACLPALQKIRELCPFVGYDSIRRGERSPILSMSMTVRAWDQSATDVPGCGSVSSASLAESISVEDAELLAGFLNVAMTAWGRDREYGRLWLAVNMTICMWLYRRIVLTSYSSKTPRLSKDQFTKCLMGLSADPTYLDWLAGRHIGRHDRAPCYARIKQIFVKRLNDMGVPKANLPAPAWTHGTKMR